MNRRAFLAAGATLAQAASRLPANKNVNLAVSAKLWNSFPKGPLTDLLDIMKDTAFIGIRLKGFPGILKTHDVTAPTLGNDMSKRGLQVATISFNGLAHQAAEHAKYLDSAKMAMEFLKTMGTNHLVVSSPGRPAPNPVGGKAIPVPEASFKTMCEGSNKVGELANSMGFKASLHNHMDQMVETPEEVDKCMARTDPKLFHFSRDSAHLHMGGSNVPQVMQKHKKRLMFADYKDVKWTTPVEDFRQENGRVRAKDSRSARFLTGIYDPGDGEIDFPGCHRSLKSIDYKGWICVDLDTARKGPTASYERFAAYVTSKLEPIYS